MITTPYAVDPPPTGERPPGRLHRLAIAICAVALVLGTSLLPYRFPPAQFVVGASYEVGFNNSVAAIAYFAVVMVMSVIAARLLARHSDSLPNVIHWSVARGSHTVAAAIIALHVALFAALYMYKGRFVFAEGLYFQSLLYRMSGGEIPYVDFGFYYGPLLVYPARWLSRYLGLDGGYAAWYVANYTIGLVFLYVIVALCARNARATAVWFVFLALGLFNPLTGVNVTFTRYLFPAIVLLVVGDFLHRGGWARGILACALFTTALLYSFDVAALSVAATGLLWLCGSVDGSVWRRVQQFTATLIGIARRRDAPTDLVSATSAPLMLVRTMVVTVGGLLAAAACFLAIDSSGRALHDYPVTAWSYASGAHNVPIYPHLPFLALSGVTVATLGALLRGSVQASSPGLLPVLATAAVLAFVDERAAFAAAEPLHFAYHGLPTFLLALFVAARVAYSARAQRALAVVLLVGIMLPMQYYHFAEFLPFLARSVSTPVLAAPPAVEPEPTGIALERALRQLVQTVGTDRPYVMYEMEYNSLPVYRDLRLKYATYSTMLITARNETGIRRAIEEVRQRRAAVVVRKHDLAGLERPRRSTPLFRLLDLVSGAHTAGSELNALLLTSKTRLMTPFLSFVRTEYAPVYDRDGLVAFVPYGDKQ